MGVLESPGKMLDFLSVKDGVFPVNKNENRR